MPQTTLSPLGSRASHKPSAKREVLLGYFFLIILTGRLIGFLIFRESSFIIYVHGHFRDVHVDSRALFFKNIHGHFKVHVHFFVKLFTGTFKIHGHFFPVHRHFLGFTGKFFLESSRTSAKYSRALFRNCSRTLFRCSRKKNTSPDSKNKGNKKNGDAPGPLGDLSDSGAIQKYSSILFKKSL